ncbi:ABC transporter ATP-binding protein [Nocardiopsis nanhaiensis]
MAGIELDRVTKRFADHTAVREVSLSVHDGEFVTLLGPSGCGKTTTLRMIAGFQEPDEGTISVDGQTLSGPGWAVGPQDRGMGMVFQNYALWPHKSVFNNVSYGLKMKSVPKRERNERVSHVLETVGLTGMEERFPNELSGGQQQRVALARSLVTSPSILLLDEPLSNLDAKLRDHMRTELQEIQRETGVTFVYVTHDQSEALSMSDRIAVLELGNVEQFAPPWQIYYRPASVTVANFMGLANFVDAQVTGVGEGFVTVEAEALGEFRVPDEGAVPDIDAGELVTVAIRPESFHVVTGAHAPTPEGATPFRAAVTHASLLGSITLATVEVAGQELQIQVSGYTDLMVGDEVWVVLSPEQTNLYRSPKTGAAVPSQRAARQSSSVTS